MVISSTFTSTLSLSLDSVQSSCSSSLRTVISSCAASMASSERLSDYHFHAALEGHSKIVSGVFERPVYGLGWKGESSYYKTGLKEELEEK
eukprot:CAMPEP_0182506726 /NCGR_PEP_ID=MMETSP1321-20130603/21804_1 /TAXON_ID=91990 /ORGANISM="Bolidomonas sp., Strain RCC1657" /LENGTH=90 /DNA_ID=CAMNT_0024712511 /DNA_START=197 /DNA_END=466 /DNA_ORIENTATION=+